MTLYCGQFFRSPIMLLSSYKHQSLQAASELATLGWNNRGVRQADPVRSADVGSVDCD